MRQHKNNFYQLKAHHNYQSRHGSDLEIPAHRTTLLEQNPYYMGAVIYNKIPNSLKIKDDKTFLNKVKLMLFSKGFYTIEEYMNAVLNDD